MSSGNGAEGALTLAVRVTARGGRDAVIGWDTAGHVLHVRVAAPPVNGSANRSVAALVATMLGLRPRQVSLVSGETARDKRFALFEIAAAELNERLAALPRLAV
jgi:hypothetical protein